MRERIESRLRTLARRAGWASAPPTVVAAGLALACVAVSFAVWRWWPSAGGASPSDSGESVVGTPIARSSSVHATRSRSAPAASIDERTAEGGSAGSTVCVDVVGAVHHPGVYVLDAGMRVAAALEAAGGANAAAATDAINLAAKVEDGQQIVVPTKQQVADGAAPVGGTPAMGTGGHTATAAKVDLNSADATQLDSLPGIGPSTAAKIVADRQTNGRFKSVEDLTRVPGIGPKKLDSLKDLIVVR